MHTEHRHPPEGAGLSKPPGVLIDADGLRALLAGRPDTVVLDVRWALGDPDGHRHYLAAHIPGAVYVDLDSELSSPPSAAHGRHPLPPIEELECSARRWGIRGGATVVAYDDVGNLSAARCWWLLRWAGLEDVRMLDGGLSAWRAGGGEIESGEVTPTPGDVVLTAGRLAVLDADGAGELAGAGILLDARAAERYRGEVEPLDPRAGHVPGALSAPTAENLRADGTFRDSAELAARFRSLGVQSASSVGVYCGSGITAAHEIAALALAGFDAALYPGSWSQWSADPSRPISP